jgi:hypothetical protein
LVAHVIDGSVGAVVRREFRVNVVCGAALLVGSLLFELLDPLVLTMSALAASSGTLIESAVKGRSVIDVAAVSEASAIPLVVIVD